MKAFSHSDPAKRLSDTYNLHRLAIGLDAVGKWFAVSLAEGRSDDVLYDHKRDCVRHQQHNEQLYAFIKIVPAGMNHCEAEVMLAKHRQMYDAGLRLTDPEDRHGGPDVIKRLTAEDELAAMLGITGTNLLANPQWRNN
jgi:hypothetical protein